MTCPDCERYKQSASMWRNKAYELGGTPLPWKPEELLRKEYERGFIDGMQKQMQSSVDKAINAMAQPEQEPVAWKDKTYGNLHHQDFGNSIPLYTTPPQRTWVGLTEEEQIKLVQKHIDSPVALLFEVEAKLKEKNTWIF